MEMLTSVERSGSICCGLSASMTVSVSMAIEGGMAVECAIDAPEGEQRDLGPRTEAGDQHAQRCQRDSDTQLG